MSILQKLFLRKPPDELLNIFDRVYVFDCCFSKEVMEEDKLKAYIEGIARQLREGGSYMVFNFGEGERQSMVTNILTEYDIAVMDYPLQCEGYPLVTMKVIHQFLRCSEKWLSLRHDNVLLMMHCERGGWPVLAFMSAALSIYRKQNVGGQTKTTLDMIYKKAPQELLPLSSPLLNPLPSQLRYLQYVSRRNVVSQWPPPHRALTLDFIVIRCIPNMDEEGGCRPIFRIHGQDSHPNSKLLFSTPKKAEFVRHYKQAECEVVKIDINCQMQGDVVLECINLDNDLEREETMFRVMFNTTFIRSNILLLNRDEIDVLWHAKDRFLNDFRVDVLFSNIDDPSSFIPIEWPNIEENYDGIPFEAFARVQEFFRNVDCLSPEADKALHMLHEINALVNNVDWLSPKAVPALNIFKNNQCFNFSSK